MPEYMIFMALASVVSTLLTNNQNKNNQNELLAWQEDQTKQAQEYNSIGAQMARAQQVGINPVSVAMGNGTINSSSVSAPSGLSPQTLQNPLGILPSLMQGLLSGQQAETEAATRDAKLNLLNKQADQLVLLCQQLGLSNDSMEIVLKYQDEVQNLTVQGLNLMNQKTFKEIVQINSTIDRINKETNELLPAQVQKLLAEKDLTLMNLPKVIQEIQNLKVTEDEIRAHTNLFDSQTDAQDIENMYKAKLTEETIIQYKLQNQKIVAETNLTREELGYIAYRSLGSSSRKILTEAGMKLVDAFRSDQDSRTSKRNSKASKVYDLLEKVPEDELEHILNTLRANYGSSRVHNR